MGDVKGAKRFGLKDAALVVAVVLACLWLVWGGLRAGHATLNTGPPTTATQQLEMLEVVEDGPNPDAPPYDRDNFGKGWGDLDGDGCNTRNEILARDLTDVTFEEGTNDCVVSSGVLAEPYKGEEVSFVKGADTSALVQIDHVVPLANAWEAGAWKWDEETRKEFSNDPLNLLAVDGQQNYVKGALTADQWLPPESDYHCQFITRQVAVKHKWDLTVQRSEAETMRKVLSKCPETVLDPQ